MLELCACRFEPFPFEVQLPRIEPGRIVIPVEEPGIAAWSGQAGVELPVHLSGLTVGRFVLVPATYDRRGRVLAGRPRRGDRHGRGAGPGDRGGHARRAAHDHDGGDIVRPLDLRGRNQQ